MTTMHAPRFHTPTDPEAPSWAGRAARFSAGLGAPPMPWQRSMLAITEQLNPAGTGLAYPYVVVSVPRRAGKTVAVLAAQLARLSRAEGQMGWYTAQKREAAAALFRKDWAPKLARDPWARAFSVRKSNGSESVTMRATGSTMSLFSPNEEALHGSDADLVVVDEAWAFTAAQGDLIEAGIQPAQLTRAYRQLWIVSAGGTAESTWLARWVDLGRAGTPGVALIDYGATEDDDLEDPAVWARVHPAIGHTIDADAIAVMRGTMKVEEFNRAVLGVWTRAGIVPPKLDPSAWAAALRPAARVTGPLSFGLAVSYDGERTAIAAAGRDADGVLVVEVFEHQAGTAWAVVAARKLKGKGKLYADPMGPSGVVIDALTAARIPVEQVTTATALTACGALLDDLRDGRLVHRGQEPLDIAARTATARTIGDRWLWDRRAGVDTSPLEAVTLALVGARRPRSRPSITTTATGT